MNLETSQSLTLHFTDRKSYKNFTCCMSIKHVVNFFVCTYLCSTALCLRTLLDNEIREERRTTVICRTLRKYHVDIAVLSETRLAEESSMEYVGAGYTYFWKGKPDRAPRT